MYNEFATIHYKGSASVRQTYYTTKRTWLVDFINIFTFILKLFLHLLPRLCFYWCYPYSLWSLHIPSAFCTGIFCLALRKNHWPLFIMPALMPKWIILALWMWRLPWLWNWYLNTCNHSLFSYVLMIPWFQNSAKILKMFQNFLTMLLTMAPTIWLDTALSVSCSVFQFGKATGSSIFLFPLDTVCGKRKNPSWSGFHAFWRENRWLLHWVTSGSYQYLRLQGGSCLCNIRRKRNWLKKAVFQYNFSRTATDLLCMAGKSTLEPDRKWPYAVHPSFMLLIPLEYNADTGIIFQRFP